MSETAKMILVLGAIPIVVVLFLTIAVAFICFVGEVLLRAITGIPIGDE